MKLLPVFALAALLTAAPTLSAADKPNILVIVADDPGCADICVHGGGDVPTPNNDAFAASGVRCTNGYATIAMQ